MVGKFTSLYNLFEIMPNLSIELPNVLPRGNNPNFKKIEFNINKFNTFLNKLKPKAPKHKNPRKIQSKILNIY